MGDLKVFALWRRTLEQAEHLAVAARRRFRDVAIVRLVDEEVLPPNVIRRLEERGIKVMSVPATHRGSTEEDEQLVSDVASFIEERAEAEEALSRRPAPKVDAAAAARVTVAYSRLVEPSVEQRKEHLREFYGDSPTDDGVR